MNFIYFDILEDDLTSELNTERIDSVSQSDSQTSELESNKGPTDLFKKLAMDLAHD